MSQRKCFGPYDLYSLKHNLVVVLQDPSDKPSAQLTKESYYAGMDLVREYADKEPVRILPESFDNNHKYYSDTWDDLTSANKEYYRHHEYLPIFYNPESKSFNVVIPSPGRPEAINPKSDKIDLRLDAQTKARLKDYCDTNKIKRSKAIRAAIELLLSKPK